MNHTRSEATLKAAQKQEASNHYDAVIEIVNLGLATEPTNVDLLLAKAEALAKLWHFQDAMSCIQVALRQNQNNAKAQRLKKAVEGQIFDQNLKDGLEFLYKAEQEKPGSSQQYKWIESALSCFLEALSYDSQNLTALAGVYRCRIRSGEPLKAQTTLERIRQIDPNYDVYSIRMNRKIQMAVALSPPAYMVRCILTPFICESSAIMYSGTVCRAKFLSGCTKESGLAWLNCRGEARSTLSADWP
jgi:tetratricopeptide (TPR) repeat protein